MLLSIGIQNQFNTTKVFHNTGNTQAVTDRRALLFVFDDPGIFQNGKVFGVLMAVSSLIFLMPMFLVITLSMPSVDQHGHPVNFPKFIFLIMPIAYLVFGYVFVAIGSWIYNFMVKYIGGIEFVLEDKSE